MEFEEKGPARHTGVEKYVVEFVIPDTGDDTYDAKGSYVQFMARPVSLRLVWERGLGQNWEPVQSFSGTGGSRIFGYRVLKDGKLGLQDTTWEIWRSKVSLTDYARSLPGLVELITRIIVNLPK